MWPDNSLASFERGPFSGQLKGKRDEHGNLRPEIDPGPVGLLTRTESSSTPAKNLHQNNWRNSYPFCSLLIARWIPWSFVIWVNRDRSIFCSQIRVASLFYLSAPTYNCNLSMPTQPGSVRILPDWATNQSEAIPPRDSLPLCDLYFPHSLGLRYSFSWGGKPDRMDGERWNTQSSRVFHVPCHVPSGE